MQMQFSLVICTYMRPKAVVNLLDSVNHQETYPDEIIIVDGSLNTDTKEIIAQKTYKNLKYFLVEHKNRGLTKQRNCGIKKATKDIICFLDDDIILTPSYFKNLIKTYYEFPEAIGVGGYIIEEDVWQETTADGTVSVRDFKYDNYSRLLGSRNMARKRFGLLSDKPPGIMPEFSNGFPISYLPPTNKTYKVDYFMGGVSSFKKTLFNQILFSEYFEGYGLYEDADFCLRASKLGSLYVNTSARLYHYHDASGRPNQYEYGKMVIRNGWYVWRVKFPNPSVIARIKWNAIAFLLTAIRVSNVITNPKRMEAFTETLGRVSGWFSLIVNKPKITL